MRRHPHLYEVHTWAWLAEIGRAFGRPRRAGSPGLRLIDVPCGVWDALKARGFDLIWLMGIWQRSPESQRIARAEPGLRAAYDRALPGWQPEDVVGSPYAIRAYEPDPALATWEELAEVRSRLRHRGMGLILDFVPNHTARDHRWVIEHPEYYVTTSAERAREQPAMFFEVQNRAGRIFVAHGRDPYFPSWTDTAQLNYFNPALRWALLEQLGVIARHCDGVRCDVAMLVLNDVFKGTWHDFLNGARAPAEEFWAEVAAELPDLLLIAEVYWGLEGRLQELGFRYTYDKTFYDRLRDNRMVDAVEELTADPAYQARLVRFLENHDEPRSMAMFRKQRLPALAALHATLPGMRFYHHGQLEGRTRHLTIQLARGPDEPSDPEVVRLYERLLRIANEPVFHEGDWKLLEVEPSDARGAGLVAYRWRSIESYALVVINLTDRPGDVRVPLVTELRAAFPNAPVFDIRDRLSRAAWTVEQPDAVLALQLEPYGVRILSIGML